METPSLSTHAAPSGSTRDHVGSLARGLAVLEVLAANPGGLTLTETAGHCALTRAGARRLLLTFVAQGYVRQAGRKFVLSAKILSLARQWIEGQALWSFAEPHLRDVSAALGESCSAAVLEGENVVYVARVAGRRIVSVSLHVGTRLPAYCTSMGRVLLSGLAEPQLENLLARTTLTANTPKTLTDRQAIADAVARVRALGYALVDQELELGLRSIAVPVRDRAGNVVAAINASTQSARFTTAQMVETFLPRLRAAASHIEDFLALQ